MDKENHRLKSIFLLARMGPLVALFHRIREDWSGFHQKRIRVWLGIFSIC